MRHGDKGNNLGRKTAHRKAMMSNMTCSLIEHKRITTTLAKAKALRVYAEPLITRSKDDSMHNRRVVFSYLQSKEAIKELFGVVGDKVANRPGGYTRIIKLPRRLGDAADMAMIELVDFNEIYNTGEGKSGPSKRTRRGRSKAGGATVAAVPATTAETTPAADDTAAVNANAAAADTANQDIAAEAEAPTPPAGPAAEEEQNQPTGENTAEGNA